MSDSPVYVQSSRSYLEIGRQRFQLHDFQMEILSDFQVSGSFLGEAVDRVLCDWGMNEKSERINWKKEGF